MSSSQHKQLLMHQQSPTGVCANNDCPERDNDVWFTGSTCLCQQCSQKEREIEWRAHTGYIEHCPRPGACTHKHSQHKEDHTDLTNPPYWQNGEQHYNKSIEPCWNPGQNRKCWQPSICHFPLLANNLLASVLYTVSQKQTFQEVHQLKTGFLLHTLLVQLPRCLNLSHVAMSFYCNNILK